MRRAVAATIALRAAGSSTDHATRAGRAHQGACTCDRGRWHPLEARLDALQAHREEPDGQCKDEADDGADEEESTGNESCTIERGESDHRTDRHDRARHCVAE